MTDKVQIEVSDKTTYNVDRSVRLQSPDPEHPDNEPIVVSVGGSVCSYKPEPEPPRLQFSLRIPVLTRKQWELVKRLGDQAWIEYEARFPVEKE